MEANVTQPATLLAAVRAVVDDALAGVNTVLPGVVKKYDVATRKAHVKPQLQRRLRSGTLRPLPVIPGVPVQFLTTAAGGLRFDVPVGTTGLLVFAQRSLERWLAEGGDADPVDPRKFDLTDAVFLPGLQPFDVRETGAVAGGLVLDYDGASLRLNGGKIALGNAGAELLDLIDRLLDKTLAATVPTAVGTYPLDPATLTNLTEIKALLALIRGTLA